MNKYKNIIFFCKNIDIIEVNATKLSEIKMYKISGQLFLYQLGIRSYRSLAGVYFVYVKLNN